MKKLYYLRLLCYNQKGDCCEDLSKHEKDFNLFFFIVD